MARSIMNAKGEPHRLALRRKVEIARITPTAPARRPLAPGSQARREGSDGPQPFDSPLPAPALTAAAATPRAFFRSERAARLAALAALASAAVACPPGNRSLSRTALPE